MAFNRFSSRRTQAAGLFASALIIVPIPAGAQTDQAQAASAEARELGIDIAELRATEAAEMSFLRTTMSGDSNARSGFPTDALKLLADSDGSNVSLTLSTARTDGVNLGKPVLSLTVSAPISDKKRKQGFLLTRDGVPGGFGAEVSILKIWGQYQPPPLRALRLEQKLLTVARERCLTDIAANRVNLTEAMISDCSINPLTTSSEGLRREPSTGLASLDPGETSLLKIAEAGTTKVAAATFRNQSVWLFSLTAAIGVDDFTYADPLTFIETEERKVGYSLTGAVGFSPMPTWPFLMGGFEYREAWEAPDAAIRCPTTAGPAPVQCTQAVFAPTERKIDHKAYGLIRFTDILGQKLPLAVELKGAYDIKDKVVGVELPIYAFVDDDNKLRGGFRIGWDSDKKNVKFGIFIGAPLDKIGL